MRLWFVFELLLFFVLLAFAAARSVVGKQEAEIATEGPVIDESLSVVTTLPAAVESAVSEAAAVVTEEIPTTPATGPSRFCKCVSLECSCCRDFRLPVLPIASSGCASLQYLRGDKLALTMRVGDAVIRNVTISGRRPRPACVNLPGGFSRFCGRVYGIQRQGDDFKACLGLEIRALADLEASMRVSCFRFSPKGVTMEAAPPLPASPSDEEDEDEDDDDGLFGFGGGDDEDDEDDDDDELPFADDEDDDETENAVAEPDVDYTGFSALGDIFGGIFEDEPESPPKKKKKPAAEKKPAIATQAATVNKVEAVTTPRAKPETTEKPMVMEIATEMAEEDKVVISTTEKQPTTTIVLSPTSSVKITTTVASTTPKAVVPDPESSGEKQEDDEEDEEQDEEQEDDEEQDEEEPEEDEGDEDEELNAEFDDDEDETTESAAESFSNEIAEAIKGVEEELSSVADIDLETDSDEKPAATDAATAAVQATTEADDELDILEEVEAFADEVSDSVTDEPEPQGGVPLNGEPRANATTTEKPARRTSRHRQA